MSSFGMPRQHQVVHANGQPPCAAPTPPEPSDGGPRARNPRAPRENKFAHILADEDYKAWRTKIENGDYVASPEPIYGFRSSPATLKKNLGPLLTHITLTPRKNTTAESTGILVEPINVVTSANTLLQFWMLLGKYHVKADSLDQIYALFRRMNAQFVAAIEEPECYATVVSTTEIMAGQRVERVGVKISGRPPQFRAEVIVKYGHFTKILKLCPEMINDPALAYAGVVSVITNPLSPHPQATVAVNEINIAPPMRFAHAAKFADKSQDKLDDMARAVYETNDGDARFVYDHVLHLMSASDAASVDARAERAEDGYNLLYKLCWVIQTCARSAQILALFSPVQQCGKTTVLDILRAVLGDGLVRSVTASRLGGQFNAFLRNLLFLFLDEGADALTCERLYTALKEITGCSMLQTEEKNQPSVPFNNVITAIITGNRTWVALEPGNERVTPYLVSGHLQGNGKYFERLYGALKDVATMEDLFLLFSRARLKMFNGDDFMPQYCSPLGSRMLARMADPALARVYAGLNQILVDCATKTMTKDIFDAELDKIVKKVYMPDEAKTIAAFISKDLFTRSVLKEVVADKKTYIKSCLRIKDGTTARRNPHPKWHRGADVPENTAPDELKPVPEPEPKKSSSVVPVNQAEAAPPDALETNRPSGNKRPRKNE